MNIKGQTNIENIMIFLLFFLIVGFIGSVIYLSINTDFGNIISSKNKPNIQADIQNPENIQAEIQNLNTNTDLSENQVNTPPSNNLTGSNPRPRNPPIMPATQQEAEESQANQSDNDDQDTSSSTNKQQPASTSNIPETESEEDNSQNPPANVAPQESSTSSSNQEEDSDAIPEPSTSYFTGEKIIKLNNKDILLKKVFKKGDYFYILGDQNTIIPSPQIYNSTYFCLTHTDYKKYFGLIKLDSKTGEYVWEYEKSLPMQNTTIESSIYILDSIMVNDGVIIFYKQFDNSLIYSQDPNYPCFVSGPSTETHKLLKINFSGEVVFDIVISFPIISGAPYDKTYGIYDIFRTKLLSSSSDLSDNSFALIFYKKEYSFMQIDSPFPVFKITELEPSIFSYILFSSDGAILKEKDIPEIPDFYQDVFTNQNKLYITTFNNIFGTNLTKIDLLSGEIDFNKQYSLYPYEVYCMECPNNTYQTFITYSFFHPDFSDNAYYMLSRGHGGTFHPTGAPTKPALLKIDLDSGDLLWSTNFGDVDYPNLTADDTFTNFSNILIKQDNKLLLPLLDVYTTAWKPHLVLINSNTGELISQKQISSAGDFDVNDRNQLSSNFFGSFNLNYFYSPIITDNKFVFLYKNYPNAYYKLSVNSENLELRLKKLGSDVLTPIYTNTTVFYGMLNQNNINLYASDNLNIIWGLSYSDYKKHAFAIKHTDTDAKFFLSSRNYAIQPSYRYLSADKKVAFVFAQDLVQNSVGLQAIDLN